MKNRKVTKPTMAGIGEILWDIIGTSEELGGAPVNFSFHSSSLGANAYPISTVGSDERGSRAFDILKGNGVSTSCISIMENGITGYVLAEIDESGSASYNFPDNVAWDNLYLNDASRELINELDAVCFGTLSQRSTISRQAILQLLEATKEDCLKVLDINLRQNFYNDEIIKSSFQLADIVKLNDEELIEIAKIEQLAGDDEYQLKTLLSRYDLELIILTRGGSGSMLLTASEVSDQLGRETKVVNTIGAGDAFTAATILAYLRGDDLAAINRFASEVAAYVCGQNGAMVMLPTKFKLF